MKKSVVFTLFFYSCLSTIAQITVKPGAIKKVETVKTTKKQANDTLITYKNLSAKLLTPEKPKIEGLGEFTYFENHANYNKET